MKKDKETAELDKLCGEGCSKKAVYFFDIGRNAYLSFCRKHRDSENYRWAEQFGRKVKIGMNERDHLFWSMKSLEMQSLYMKESEKGFFHLLKCSLFPCADHRRYWIIVNEFARLGMEESKKGKSE